MNGGKQHSYHHRHTHSPRSNAQGLCLIPELESGSYHKPPNDQSAIFLPPGSSQCRFIWPGRGIFKHEHRMNIRVLPSQSTTAT